MVDTKFIATFYEHIESMFWVQSIVLKEVLHIELYLGLCKAFMTASFLEKS